MKIRIYQVKKECSRDFGFMRYEWFQKQGHEKMSRDMYNLVFDGNTNEKDLEGVYEEFNLRHPEGFKGHSLSVSDLVENEEGLFFCDSFGFKKVEWEDVAI